MEKNESNKSKIKSSIEHSSKSIKHTTKKSNPEANKDDSMTEEQENQYKERIIQLQKELEEERKKIQEKQLDPNAIMTLKNEINSKNKEIKRYANNNTKQRDQLEQLSQEIDNKLNKMNYKAVTRSLKNESKKINYLNSGINSNYFLTQDQKNIDNSISAKEKQLKNIMSLIEILNKENENLKMKIENAKNTEQKFKLIDDKKEQEKQLNLLNIDIKKKKMELKEHSRCFAIKTELLKKISMIKEEIVIAHEKLADVKKKYEDLENKIKLEQQNSSNSQGTKSYKLINKPKNKFQKYIVPKQKSPRVIQEENAVDIPPKLSEIFTEKELNAMFVALDKNRTKYDAMLRRFNVQYIYVDSLEARHKLDIKQKLDKINSLDEQIEFMSVKKGEYNANIQVYKKQIMAAQEEKRNFKNKIDSMTEEISKKNKINLRKDNEIKMLQAQLTKFKKYLKSGELEKIQNESEIELKGDEESSDIIGSNEGGINSTAKTGFYENKENDINNIKVNKEYKDDKNEEDTNEKNEEGSGSGSGDHSKNEGDNALINNEGTNTGE
jgi:hypothetical protein